MSTTSNSKIYGSTVVHQKKINLPRIKKRVMHNDVLANRPESAVYDHIHNGDAGHFRKPQICPQQNEFVGWIDRLPFEHAQFEVQYTIGGKFEGYKHNSGFWPPLCAKTTFSLYCGLDLSLQKASRSSATSSFMKLRRKGVFAVNTQSTRALACVSLAQSTRC